MAQTTLNVRMDEDVKKQFVDFCDDVGMNVSVAVNLFAKAVLRERKIPFEISQNTDPFYSEKNQARLIEAIERMNTSGGTVRELVEVDNE